MGLLIPDDFPLSSLANDAERDVVRLLRDRLSDSWLVIANVGLRAGRDYQLDVVLLHRDLGLLDLEIKGHRASPREGVWSCQGSPLEPQPFQQAQGNAYALRNRLRKECGSTDAAVGGLRVS